MKLEHIKQSLGAWSNDMESSIKEQDVMWAYSIWGDTNDISQMLVMPHSVFVLAIVYREICDLRYGS